MTSKIYVQCTFGEWLEHWKSLVFGGKMVGHRSSIGFIRPLNFAVLLMRSYIIFIGMLLFFTWAQLFKLHTINCLKRISLPLFYSLVFRFQSEWLTCFESIIIIIISNHAAVCYSWSKNHFENLLFKEFFTSSALESQDSRNLRMKTFQWFWISDNFTFYCELFFLSIPRSKNPSKP